MVPKLCAGDAWLQLVLAETLAKADEPDAHRDLVERALGDAAAAEDVDPRWLAGARHELLVRTDPDAAKDLLETYVKGDADQAEELASTAYLEHFELVEGPLEEADAELNEHLEELIREELRNAITADAPVAEVKKLVAEANDGLDEARTVLKQQE